ncbi:MAG: hypothetical protein E6K80_03145 [Candidatus Eisenbacteria bacterium]|uniref:FlgD/Vpr Ig-like domain-containing protein n=1 Tax=Eiseniibacteriota bacterium TaxID=2212470 RepID=A0A538U8T3_UNCEI|nr:MAG: hypothetical protein E6K80_03145 [Candidatus Eisenbacteria bacterium]
MASSPVGFEVLDAAGRRVAQVSDRSWSAGRWSVAWNGTDQAGVRLAPGVYFVRMRVNEQAVGLRKVALLN